MPNVHDPASVLGVFPVELLAYQVLMACAEIGQDSFIYIRDIILGECMTSSVISFAYFTRYFKL